MDDTTANPFLASLKDAWSEGSFEKPDYFEGAEPPTSAPHINDLVGSGLAAAKGRMGQEEYRNVLAATRERLEESVKIFQGYFALGTLPDEVREEAERVLQAFDEQRSALDELEKFLDDGDPAHITRGNDATVEAAFTLIAAYQRFGELTVEYGKVDCFRCGHRNVSTNKLCEKCHVDLSLREAVESPKQGETAKVIGDIPPAFALLSQALEGVKGGVVPLDQFAVLLGQFRMMLEQNLPEMDKILNKDMFNLNAEMVGEEMFCEFQGLAVAMKESILAAMAGLTDLERYAAGADEPGALDSGWEQMLAGGRQMLTVSNAMGALMEKVRDSMEASARAEGEDGPAAAFDMEEKVELQEDGD